MLTAGIAKGTRPSSITGKAYLLGRPLPPTPDFSPANFSHLASLSPLPPAGARPPLDNGSTMTTKIPTLSADDDRGPYATCVAKSSSILSKLKPPVSPLPSHRSTYNSDRNGFISSQRPAKHQTPSTGPTAMIFETALIPIPVSPSPFAFRDSPPSSSTSAAPAPPPASIMVSPHDSPSVHVVKSQSQRRSHISSVVATLTTNKKVIGHSFSLSALTCICGSKCDAIFDEMSRNLDDAVFEYSECICLSKGACAGEVKKPDNPPENARLQRLWFHALDMKDYMGMLEGYIDELEGSLKEYVCTRMKQRDLVELERTRLQCELEVVKTRTTLLGRWR
ncbi:hypothetical protein BGZ98_000241 [Dissophora globulifera]|nr:hypothetical protein BGZ98_000241 [Dissophora globulifera]